MLEQDPIMEIPAKQKMERQKTLDREHSKEYKAALRRAVTLAIPHAFLPSRYGTFEEKEVGENSNMSSGEDSSTEPFKNSKAGESWDDLKEHLFEKTESGNMVLKKSCPED